MNMDHQTDEHADDMNASISLTTGMLVSVCWVLYGRFDVGVGDLDVKDRRLVFDALTPHRVLDWRPVADGHRYAVVEIRIREACPPSEADLLEAWADDIERLIGWPRVFVRSWCVTGNWSR